jgi:hypothetical protein
MRWTEDEVTMNKIAVRTLSLSLVKSNPRPPLASASLPDPFPVPTTFTRRVTQRKHTGFFDLPSLAPTTTPSLQIDSLTTSFCSLSSSVRVTGKIGASKDLPDRR